MSKKVYEKVVKKFYECLDEGKIMGRRCPSCGHMEFPPYLACNECGNYEGMEWAEISGKGIVTQMVPCPMIFADPGFAELTKGEYVLATVKPEDSDEYSVPVIGISPEEATEMLPELPLPAHAVIFQDNGYKFVCWELDER